VAASLLISGQSAKVITLQSSSVHFSPPNLFIFRAPPTPRFMSDDFLLCSSYLESRSMSLAKSGHRNEHLHGYRYEDRERSNKGPHA